MKQNEKILSNFELRNLLCYFKTKIASKQKNLSTSVDNLPNPFTYTASCHQILHAMPSLVEHLHGIESGLTSILVSKRNLWGLKRSSIPPHAAFLYFPTRRATVLYCCQLHHKQ